MRTPSRLSASVRGAVSGDSGMRVSERRWGKSEEVSVRWNDNAVRLPTKD